MPLEVAFLIGALVLTTVAYFLGNFIGRSTGAKEASKAAWGIEERARDQVLAQSRHMATLKENQQQLLELIVNLPDTVNKMGAARSTSALCRITVRAMMDLAGAKRVGFFVAFGSPPKFRLEVYTGNPRPKKKVVFELGSGKLGSLAQLIGVRSHHDAIHAHAKRSQEEADSLFSPEMCVSIRRHEKIYGFLAMDGVNKDDPMIRRIVQMLADVHAVSAEGLAILQQERVKADIDKLTGLFNRRHLDRRLAEEMARSQSYGTPVSVFLFDIDNFKHFNDTNGHQAGDECLKRVAKLTRDLTRGSDVVCRYGGEEFLIILLGAKTEEAFNHADRIRDTICKTDFEHGSKQPLGCVSISGGVASFPNDATQPEQLIELADKALYVAKESGRNRVLRADRLGDFNAPPNDDIGRPKFEHSSVPVPFSVAPIETPPPIWAPAASMETPFHLSSSSMLRSAEPVHTPMPEKSGAYHSEGEDDPSAGPMEPEERPDSVPEFKTISVSSLGKSQK